MSYGESYQDRGMVKWAGFYVSEHTDTLNDQMTRENNCPQQKMQMDIDEIGTILSEAQRRNKEIAIQIEERLGDRTAAGRFQQRLREEFPSPATSNPQG